MRIASSRPGDLVLLDACESHLYRLQQALTGTTATTFVLGNCGDRGSLEEIFSTHKPRLVIHAAAYKHVPLLERAPFAAIMNNIFVTETVAAVAAEHGARLLLLSTDKAVQPASVMGTTKRIAEEIVLDHGGTAVRMANVLASSGSVVEVFARQLAQGHQLTVTHPDVRRYFVTMEEVSNLLLCATAIASPVLLAPVLPVDHRIVDLANFMARQLAPDRNVPLCFTGMRPGDKLSEQLSEPYEVTRPATASLLSIHPICSQPASFASSIAALKAAVATRDLRAALAILQTLVPGFQPGHTLLQLAYQRAPRVYA